MRKLIVIALLLTGCLKEEPKDCVEGAQWVEQYGRYDGALWECRRVWHDAAHTHYHRQWVRITPNNE